MFSSKKNKNSNVYVEPDNIGDFLKQCRIDKNLTQLELGNILDVSPKTISKWENNNGFPDQLYQMPLCNALDITLEELHSGRLNIKQRNKEKKETRIKFALVFFIGLLLIIIVILFASMVYYKYFYNPLTLKYIDVTNDEQTVCNIDGYYIQDRSINMLYIGNIKLLNEDISDKDLIEVNFIYKDEIIFTAASLRNISINLNNIDTPNDIRIDIIVKDIDSGKEKYREKFNIIITKIHSNKENVNYDLNTNAIIKELERMGFHLATDGVYKKENKDDITLYDPKSQIIVLNNYGESRFIINYKMSFGEIDVSLTSKIKNEYVVTEKYTYNMYNQNLNNAVGYGYSLDVVLKMLEPYINLRNRYLVSTN